MPSLTETQQVALLEFVRDIVRDQPFIPFHQSKLYEPLPAGAKSIWGETAPPAPVLRAAISALSSEIQKTFPGLAVTPRPPGDGSVFGIEISVTGETEWTDALRFAHGSTVEDATHRLSPSAAELLVRLQDGRIGNEFISELSLRRRIHFYGYGARITDLAEELRIKRGLVLRIEEKGEKWQQRKHQYRLTLPAETEAPEIAPGYNPILPADITASAGAIREFRRWFFQALLDGRFEGSGTVAFWSIGSRREYRRCFPGFAERDEISYTSLTPLLEVVRTGPGISVGWDLDWRSSIWRVEVTPAEDWAMSLAAITAQLEAPSPEEQFGLSPAAATLYDWVRSIPANELELGLTPPVEPAIQNRQLLLSPPWEMDNLPLYVRLLCEEISALTGYVLEAVTWRKHGRPTIRLLTPRFGTRSPAEVNPARPRLPE